MRYKSFTISAEVAEYNVYNSLPSLMYIEVNNVIITSTLPKYTSRKQVIMSEDDPAFNFDLWANNVEGEGDFLQEFMGTKRLNQFMIKHFLHVIEYYRDNELL